MSLDIKRIPIQPNSSDFEEIWDIYINSFPEEERRHRDAQENLIKEIPYYHCEGLFDSKKIIGLFFWWDFPMTRFIEHFATHTEYRNKGIGKVVMNDFMPEKDTPIILEVELPEDELQQRRIKFYQRLGFHINAIEYLQAPYRVGEPFSSLLLASYPTPLTPSLSSYFASDCLPIIYLEHYHSIRQRNRE
ncbi:acetyltransferase (GNAT) family protein [Balneicella halophila]|uniref:Acetyltransferase (GNAT) family protein n=1 Tax=Balneicella halophila TaxID=1537566 RepID=A0A7L4UQH5_BALHA|nr:GNAT family N-acetyltransferase [Balneicella halophila]PVX49990.1 acetyltransferase (GNAT) family protein [Balneicella halophila]